MIMPYMWTTMSSSLASLIFFLQIFRRYCPSELRRYLQRGIYRIRAFFYPYVQISIHEFIGSNLKPHKAYRIVEAYLNATTLKSAKRLKAEMMNERNKLMLSMDEYEKVTDMFHGAKIWWLSGKATSSLSAQSMSYLPERERRYYRLVFHKKYRKMITESYLEHVIREGKKVNARNRRRKLYINGQNKTMWSHIVFEHPATFDTLAMEPEKKQEIIEDLLTFKRSKDFYARIGKAWKRGYLLYGPPGTGKSTVIAAMANLLNYNVYDLELTSVKDNSELRRLLAETTSRSIIVIEDIDCSLDLTGQRKKHREKSSEEETEMGRKESSRKDKEETGSRVTLSGLLNFIDGLWSACGRERLIVFTTNYIDKLDPALTRRGRMDKHIELSYCSFEGFKVLARNYLKLEDHPLFEAIEHLMETKITPADVAENLIPKSPKEDAEKCLLNLIQALEEAKEEQAMNLRKEESEREQKTEAQLQEEQEPQTAPAY